MFAPPSPDPDSAIHHGNAVATFISEEDGPPLPMLILLGSGCANFVDAW